MDAILPNRQASRVVEERTPSRLKQVKELKDQACFFAAFLGFFFSLFFGLLSPTADLLDGCR